ncbi:putative nucleotidyltransferase with HDIG domain [Actinokineospora baliensis]|uniref:HD domain-containing protein n=1 Tax=Actinokineospora baliensis TaxID=547056 RepID=UPI001957966B|nr:HD domain-containing protein [Actinokineospora baliensis]MBM7775551.1 putative nucleotidyltransferase with HDIG domain [Actinokineospora baliensis]
MPDPALVVAAVDLAASLLFPMRTRWHHTIGVAYRAGELTGTVDPAEREVLVAAAWLHDIGYAARDTGFHPVDGARHLAGLGWPPRLVALVAHHSGARFTAQAQGLGHLMAPYPHEDSPLSDALAYADQTTDPGGSPVTLRGRLAEMLARHGSDSANARAHHLRGPYLHEVADRVESRL